MNASDLLDLWDSATALGPARRALALLASARPDQPAKALAEWSVGRRDDALLTLRSQLFGAAITATADCPNCGERAEMGFDTDAVRAPDPPADDGTLSVDGYDIRLRPVNGSDLIEIADCGGVAEARQALLARCVIDAVRGGERTPVARLPEAVIAAIEDRLAELDPQADVRLALVCPACGYAWSAAFDIASFLWIEIDAWAQRTLDDVHQLAAAYHWSERDILAMSAHRRSQYLERLG